MAITPRTIFTSPASATVATISLLAFSAVGTLAYKVAQQNTPEAHQVYSYQATESCSGIREVLGHDRAAWSETDWLVYASCFEQKNNARMAAKAASQGLRYYPASEPLYNLKGYHEIVLGEHAEAVNTLEKGLRNVGNPSSGVLENNLAWAGLWVPREMDRERARVLYKRSLRRNAGSCETIHTGLWVEYAIARETRGVEKYQALKNFLDLRGQYDSCQERIESGDWKSLVEVVGATVLFQDVDENLSVPHAVTRSDSDQDGTEELHRVTQKLRENYRGVSIDALCREASPLASAHHLCTDAVGEAVHTLKKEEVRAERDDRRHRDAVHIIRSAGGGGGCVRTN